ncbi:MAG: BamA/TamA family outer membrane protein, partial [FCB group bacterium]
STKGERWFRFVFSIPDFEIRHGTRFDYAIDLSIDYDLYLRNSFFGVGMGSNFNNRSYYSKEPLDINLSMSRGFSETYTGRIGVRYKIVNNYNIDKNIYNNPDLSSLKEGKAERYSYFLTFTYDTKDNRLNPKKGYFIEAEWENSPFVKIQNPELKIQNFVLNRFSFEAQYYYYIEFLKTVFASRFKSEWLSNIDLPVQFLLPIGGNNTLRGFPQDRFLDKAYGLVNSELRFPIWCRLGGILGLDMGRVWSSIEEFSFYNWRITPAVGLRFYMDTFIIRADLGFSNEFTGVNLNINHIF